MVKSLFRTRYRILTDNYCGYEAQFRYWWSPFWYQCFWINTSYTLKGAKEVIEKHKKINNPQKVVEYD